MNGGEKCQSGTCCIGFDKTCRDGDLINGTGCTNTGTKLMESKTASGSFDGQNVEIIGPEKYRSGNIPETSNWRQPLRSGQEATVDEDLHPPVAEVVKCWKVLSFCRKWNVANCILAWNCNQVWVHNPRVKCWLESVQSSTPTSLSSRTQQCIAGLVRLAAEGYVLIQGITFPIS